MRRMRVGFYINISIALVLALSAGIIIFSINNIQRKQALWEAEEKSKIILNRNLATHTYFSHDLKPKVFELANTVRNENER